MVEKWLLVEEFPKYSVSNLGRVLNMDNGKILIRSLNQRGIPSVGLLHEGRIYRRSVAVLVAKAFLDDPGYKYDVAAPINLDGDRTNNCVDNLMWRPRNFAVDYHRQLIKYVDSWGYAAVRLDTTGEEYEHIIECCMQYGLLAHRVHAAMDREIDVYPYRFRFSRL